MRFFILTSPVVVLLMSCANAGEYKFVDGNSLCVDSNNVLSGKILYRSGGVRYSSVNILMPENKNGPLIVGFSSGRLLGNQYYDDLRLFAQRFPGATEYVQEIGLYKIDVLFKPAAEVNSMRLVDQLLPGDGSQWFYVEPSLIKVDSPDKNLPSLFVALCWVELDEGAPLCERRMSFNKLNASYKFNNGTLEDWKENDENVKNRLRSIIKQY